MAVGVGAPGPELAALADVVVAGEHGTGADAVVVAAHIVVLKVVDEDRVAGKGRKVFPPAHVHPDEVFIALVGFVRHGPVDMAELVVEHSELRVFGEDYLVVLVRVGGDIVPVQDGVAVGAVVEQSSRDLDVAALGTQSEPDSPAHAVTAFDLTHPDGLGAVPVVYEGVVNGVLARRPVVMEHVPFHTAAQPCTKHSDVRGLDDTLAVEDFIAVCFVGGRTHTFT